MGSEELDMQIKPNRLLVVASPVLLALVVAISPSIAKDYIGQDRAALVAHTYGVQFQQPIAKQSPRSDITLADAHADICLENEQNCLNSCGGATSCSNQCRVNYDGCMSQNQ